SCAMSMLEVCYEVRGSVEFLIGTESFVQNNGWPYDRILKPLADDDDALSVAKKMANIYGDFYTEFDVGGVSTDIAVVDVRALEGDKPPLIDAVKRLAHGMKSLLPERPEYEGRG